MPSVPPKIDSSRQSLPLKSNRRGFFCATRIDQRTFVNNQRVREGISQTAIGPGRRDRLQVEVTADEQFRSRCRLGPRPDRTKGAIVVVECLNCGRRDHAELRPPRRHMTFLAKTVAWNAAPASLVPVMRW